MLQPADLAAAVEFVETNARLIDRHRLAHLLGGPAEPVLAALRPYQNADGGFGNALEPDVRDPASQTVPTSGALELLADLDAFDDPMVPRALDWLASITLPDGAVPFALPTVADHPRAPWMVADGQPSLIQTGAFASVLHRQGSDHPWLGPATEWMWTRAEAADFAHAYEARFTLAFLDSVADAERAEQAVRAIGPVIERAGLVELDPDAPGEVHSPLDFSPLPGTRSRALFAGDVIELHLDALERGQLGDGGWNFNWLAWAPGPALEWRGAITVTALTVLQANGRETR
jgi:hypothetical protein